MFTVGFYKDMFERTVATFAEALGAVLLASGAGLLDIHWAAALSVAGLAALLTVLKGFAASAVSSTESGASFGTAVPKGTVAAIEDADVSGQYTAEEASPYAEGTPVEVTPEDVKQAARYGKF